MDELTQQNESTEQTTTHENEAPKETAASDSGVDVPRGVATIAEKMAAEGVQPTPQAPAYTPNLKYKVLDKELEFDPEFKDVVTKKEIEEKLRDLYTKASGLDPIKADREKIRGEFQKTKSEFENVMRGIQPLNHFLNNKDYDNFFSHLGIPEKDILDYALARVNLKDLPEDVQSAYNKSRELEAQNYFMQQQMQEFQSSQFQTQQTQARVEYDQVISQPEVNSFVSQFEAKNGQGSFMQEVRMRGLMFHQQNGYDLRPQQIVEEILSRYNLTQAQAPQQQQPQATFAQPVQQQQQQEQVPVIPVAKSTGQSIVAKKPRNLKELRAEIEARQNS